jgi:membrane protein implicated in regulation of membrane protease activity
MNPKTPRALVEFSAILLVVGLIIMDPLADLLFLVLSGILTAIALAFGSKRVRLIALILLAIIFSLAVWKYPDARLHLQRYRERAHKQQTTVPQERNEQQKEKGSHYYS